MVWDTRFHAFVSYDQWLMPGQEREKKPKVNQIPAVANMNEKKDNPSHCPGTEREASKRKCNPWYSMAVRKGC